MRKTDPKMELLYQMCPSPLGPLRLEGKPDGTLVRLLFPRENQSVDPEIPQTDRFHSICSQLEAYFQKSLTRFDLPLDPQGSEFQRAVWAQLQEIPWGCCISYGELAQRIGNPGASRAVGMANNRNPIPIIIPCHRVIGQSGSLVGFGGGVSLKHELLCHEGYYLL